MYRRSSAFSPWTRPSPRLRPRVLPLCCVPLGFWLDDAMSEEEAEYEVESILKARVAKKNGRKEWLYWVKWKNYGIADNTWEPTKSFADGSEHFIEHFWGRVDTGGRDYHHLREFNVDEEFFPAGPPRRKKAKAKQPVEVIEIPSSPEPVNPDSETEVRSIIADDNEEPVAATTRSKRRRSSTGTGAEPSPAKRKRGRPPGITPAELEAQQKAEALNRRRSVPEIPRTNRARPPVAGPSTPLAAPVPIPRRQGRISQTSAPRRSSSPDELLLSSKANGKRSSPAKKLAPESVIDIPSDRESSQDESASRDAAETSAMIVDESESEPPPFGAPSLLAVEPTPDPTSAPEPAPAPEAGPSTSIPAHHKRAANPRVRLLDDPNLTESSGALSVKARFMKRNTDTSTHGDAAASPARRPRVAKGKAGPGRSSESLIVGGSRLVAQKGKLTTVRPSAGAAISRASQELSSTEQSGDNATGGRGGLFFDVSEMDDVPGLGQVEPPPQSPPTGKQLLQEAGLDPSATNDLPDFEEDAEGEDDVEFVENNPRSQGASATRKTNKDAQALNAEGAPSTATPVVEKPPLVLEARPLTFASRVTSAWSQSTIFGPLALGLSPTRKDGQDEASSSSSAPRRYTLNLNLDPSVSLPITLKDTHAPTTFLENIDATARNPTGKFYKDQFAISLVNTLKPQGAYARVTLSDGATDEQKKHWERFVSRLTAGELFIQMNHFEPLVMCASENSVLGQKLTVPGPLLGLVDTVVVAHVSIEDHCVYAEAAEHADGARW
ncbi:hypothetical protein C8Q77DRAFT_1207118 [Trametes polyzona]|nr:hypothetical protein C8Q77DRAFT_1207118 [Trametes polyzona]